MLFDSDTAPFEVIPFFTKASQRARLEERMATRRANAERVVRDSLAELAVCAEDCNFHLTPMDPRQHCYVAVLDVTVWFAPTLHGVACTREMVEYRIRRNAIVRYGLII